MKWKRAVKRARERRAQLEAEQGIVLPRHRGLASLEWRAAANPVGSLSRLNAPMMAARWRGHHSQQGDGGEGEEGPSMLQTMRSQTGSLDQPHYHPGEEGGGGWMGPDGVYGSNAAMARVQIAPELPSLPVLREDRRVSMPLGRLVKAATVESDKGSNGEWTRNFGTMGGLFKVVMPRFAKPNSSVCVGSQF